MTHVTKLTNQLTSITSGQGYLLIRTYVHLVCTTIQGSHSEGPHPPVVLGVQIHSRPLHGLVVAWRVVEGAGARVSAVLAIRGSKGGPGIGGPPGNMGAVPTQLNIRRVLTSPIFS